MLVHRQPPAQLMQSLGSKAILKREAGEKGAPKGVQSLFKSDGTDTPGAGQYIAAQKKGREHKYSLHFSVVQGAVSEDKLSGKCASAGNVHRDLCESTAVQKENKHQSAHIACAAGRGAGTSSKLSTTA